MSVRLSLCSIAFCLALLPGSSFAEPHPFEDRADHWLAFDTRAFDPDSAKDLELVHGTVEKHPGNPLMPADKPWEEGLNNLYPNIDYDADGKIFKLWYKCILEDKALIDRMQPPRTTHDVGWYLLYATSRDGLKWDKPLFDHNQFSGAGPTNAVARDTPNAGVFRDTNPACPPDRRYKMVFDTGPGNMFVRFSADGIHWAEPLAVTIPGFRTGDTHNNAFWDARLKKYVLITRFYLGERTIARAESADFIDWQPSEMVLRPTIEEGTIHQLYCMSAFRYGNAYIGLLMNYHLGVDRTVDCELAWSPDSREWHRLLPGRAFLPLGPEGSYDSKCIYAQANPPVIGEDGRLMIFYGGDDAEHRGWVRSCLPCLATVRRDGFAGWHPTPAGAGEAAGSIETHPLEIAGDVGLSADINEGASIRVSVLDKVGKAIDGFSVENFSPVTASATDAVLRWGDQTTSQIQGRIVRLKIEIAGDATLFSLTGLTDPGRVELSPKSRPFSDELTITLGAPPEKAGVVRYTTDGREPDTSSPVAEGGNIVTRDSITLAARFFPEGRSDGEGGAVSRQTYTRRQPWTGERNPVRHTENFDADIDGWKAYEQAVHVAAGGVGDSGYVRAERTKKQNPYLSSYPASSGGVFAGDLAARYGGVGLDISFSQRADGTIQPGLVGIFAEELAQWSYKKMPKTTGDWTRVRVGIRYDWSDEEAKAAGWEPEPDSFSWRETIAHAGRIAFAPIIFQQEGEKWSYDIDDVTFQTIFEDPLEAGLVED